MTDLPARLDISVTFPPTEVRAGSTVQAISTVGIGTPIPPASYDLATSTQGAKADTALQADDLTKEVLLDGGVNVISEEKNGFWSNRDDTPPKVWRFSDRVFVGSATLMHDLRSADNETWLGSNAYGASWAPRDSLMSVMQERGGIALMGASRSSDGDDVAFLSPIGVAGYVLNDTSIETRAGWALYADVQHQPTATDSASYGLEIAAKNKGSDITGGSYGTGRGVFGIWMQGGGDASYGGSPTNPNNAGIVILKGSSTWNRGLIFTADSLTGTDGVTGTGQAIVMAKGHTIRWEITGANLGARIRSDVSIAGRDVGLIFDNFSAYISNNSGEAVVRFEDANSGGVSTGVNFARLIGGASGSAVTLGVGGSDTNIDLALSGKGSGVLQFGSFSTVGAETVTGYITIKDSGGISRKLAVIA